MIKAVAATPLTRAELTALIGEHDENTLVELGKYTAKIKPYPADSTLAVVDTVKEGGRLWGIRPAQRDIDGCDYIAFLAKNWYVELIVAKENKNADTKDL